MILATLGGEDIPLELNGIRVHRLGYVGHEPTKVLAYSAADILVYPAPVDNLPNVVMEAIACGTPVVAASVGGLSDMVCHGQTGWLADEASPAALAGVHEMAFNDLK
jgi:glycosyltransferase involved in cell wall biosynthesis